MENKKTLGVYPIIHNNRIQSLRSFLNTTRQMYDYQKINLSNSDFTNYLKITCYHINEKIFSTIQYYQYNRASIINIEKAKEKCKDLSILLNKYKTELIKLDINPDEYLSFKKEIDDAFDFELTENLEGLLPNYLEIEKEFLDYLNNEKLQESKIENKTRKTEDKNWFIIGVKFATGEIQNLLKENNATQVAKALGNEKGFRPYISSSMGTEKVKTDKNIFNRKKEDIESILKYCLNHNFEVCQDFKDKTSHILTN